MVFFQFGECVGGRNREVFDASLLCFPIKDPNRSSPRCPAPESTSVMRTSHPCTMVAFRQLHYLTQTQLYIHTGDG
jgi:hypothetical protein